jgi:hypothetical protein
LFLIVLFDDVALPETLVVELAHPCLLVFRIRDSAQNCLWMLAGRRIRLKDLCEGLITK